MITTLSRQDHPLVKHWIALREERKARETSGTCFLTSPHEIEELPPERIHTLILEESHPIPDHLSFCSLIRVSSSLMKKITGCAAPVGIAAEVMLPSMKQALYPWTLVLDGVADPGNVGTLLRSAVAFGWEGVIFLPGCADPFNDKCLRSAKGAVFQIPLCRWEPDALLEALEQSSHSILIADCQGTAPQKSSAPLCLVMGNEAHGPSSLWQGKPRCHIPISSDVDSLNVAIAGSILMGKIKGIF